MPARTFLASCLLLSCGGSHARDSTEPAPTVAAQGATEGVAPVATEGVAPEGRVVVENTIEILDPISFTEGSTLHADSHPILGAIASTLIGNPEILEVAVVATAEDLALAEQRGQTIIDALVAKGVAAERLRNRPVVAPEVPMQFEILRRQSDSTPTPGE